MAGILNNPTSENTGYLDDKTKEEIPKKQMIRQKNNY